MKKKILSLLTLIIGLSYSLASKANDSVASTPGRDLVLEKSTTIRMKKEILSITPKKVTVEYTFLNEEKVPQKKTIAFPLAEYWGIYHGTVGGGESQFEDFSVVFDGKKIATKTKSLVKFDDKDITDEMRKLGVPVHYFPKIKDIPKKTFDLITNKGWYSTENMDQEMGPMYTIQNTLYWPQEFPSQKEVLSHHTYTPELGGNSIFTLSNDWDEFMSKMEMEQKIGTKGKLRAQYYEYILSTGSNWKNGIEDLDLRVDGAALILIQIDGRKDFDLGSYRFTKKNFKPTKELTVEFVGIDEKPILPKGVDFEKVINGPANCRKDPGGKLIKELKDKEKVLVRERRRDWYKVEHKNQECWTHRKNLQFLAEASTPN